jgi:hypothetical protein
MPTYLSGNTAFEATNMQFDCFHKKWEVLQKSRSDAELTRVVQQEDIRPLQQLEAIFSLV